MAITLVRIDDRVIHGQTTTRWSKVLPVDGILVISDEIANDELRKKVLKAAAGNLKLGVYPIGQGVEKIIQGSESNKNFFLISNTPLVFKELIKLGAQLPKVLNIGPMNSREGALTVGKTLAISKEDYDAFDYIFQSGIKLEFQLVPGDEIKDWPSIKSKYDSIK